MFLKISYFSLGLKEIEILGKELLSNFSYRLENHFWDALRVDPISLWRELVIIV